MTLSLFKEIPNMYQEWGIVLYLKIVLGSEDYIMITLLPVCKVKKGE